MTTTWAPDKDTRSIGAVGRTIAFVLAASACALVAYLAVTQKFSAIADFIDDINPIPVVVEEIPPPVPPPVVRDPPPQAQRETIADTDAPLTPTTFPVDETPPPIAPPTPAYIDATFLERPNGRDFATLFPRRALERGVSGRVVLDCSVAASGRLSCAVASEGPAGWGFGAASLRAAELFRVAPAMADGRPTSGGRLRVPLNWRVE